MTSGLLRSLATIFRSRAFKTLVGVVVLVAVARHVVQVLSQIPPDRYDLAARPWGFVASTATYLLGLCCFGWFYGRILERAGMPIPYGVALRAYLISHLGKYVPGKAFVVILRAGLSNRGAVSPASAAFATLYETLLMMSAGSFLAAAGFATSPVEPFYVLVAFVLGVGFFVVVSPPVFPRVGHIVKTPFRSVGAEAIPRVSWRLVLEGLLSASIGWVLLGASLAWIVEGIGERGVVLGDWPCLVASVAFATVSGFVVAVLPGGLGIREGVLMLTLAPCIGDPLAALAALLLRLTWVVGELLAAATLFPIHRTRTRRPVPPCSAQ